VAFVRLENVGMNPVSERANDGWPAQPIIITYPRRNAGLGGTPNFNRCSFSRRHRHCPAFAVQGCDAGWAFLLLAFLWSGVVPVIEPVNLATAPGDQRAARSIRYRSRVARSP
jgi:hypothetical protein